MKTSFIPLDYSSFDFEGKNYVKIFGRDSNEKRLWVIDSYPIYLWAVLKDGLSKSRIEKLISNISQIQLDLKGRKTKVEKVEIFDKNFLGREVKALKIYATNYKDLHDIADRLDFPEIEKRRGYDLGYVTSYIIESGLNPLEKYEIDSEVLTDQDFGGISSSLEGDFVLKLKSKKNLGFGNFQPRVLAYDIETDSLKVGEGEILMVSLVGRNFKKVLSWKKAKTNKDYVEFLKDESALIERFVEVVKEYSPDVLVGYNSDSFDLPFFRERAKKLKVPFLLGLDGSQPKFSRGATPVGKISGIVHIDLLKFIRTTYSQYMKSETLSLNEVSKEFLGDTKKDFKIEHSSKLKEKNWEDYYEYNLHDSVLTFQLFENFWPDLQEFTRVIKEPLFEISRNGLSRQIESYILHNLNKYNEIPEKRPGQEEISQRRLRGGVQGAFVYQPIPGLYEDLAMFDFTSMHTSIIISHNISKSTLTEKKIGSFASPEIDVGRRKKRFYFSKKPGFFPLLMKDIFEKRKKYKAEYAKNKNALTKARSNAFKLLSASAHGYVGFFGARYYSWESSASILALVRKYNLDTIKKIEKRGYKIIMGDTDSVAFSLEGKTKSDVRKLLNQLNSHLPGVMNLELENFFKRGLFVATRHGETGAKKKYAMIDEEGNIKIRGFETVRRDWCKLARKLQDKVLSYILQEGKENKALKYVEKIVEDIKNRKIELDDLVIKTQLRKPLSEYKALSPHVVAAKKMKEKNSNFGQGGIVEYYLAESPGRSNLVRDKVKLRSEKGDYDVEYYLNKQVLPSVENIFHVFGIEIKEIISGKKQENLERWF